MDRIKMTLLDLTQNILSAMDAEEVDSIGDTIESMQVAEEIRTTFYENLGNFEVPSRFELIGLDAIDDPLREHPTTVKVPDNVDQFKWLKYDISEVNGITEYIDLTYCTPEEFLKRVLEYPGSKQAAKDIVNDVSILIPNDKNPQFWTTFDDTHIVLDSFNIELDPTCICNKKFMAFAEVLPGWTHIDEFIPDIHAKHFPLLLSEAKSACFINYKGVSSVKEEQRSRRQRVRLMNNQERHPENDNTSPTNYGR